MTNATVSTRTYHRTTSTATLPDGAEIDLPYTAADHIDPFLSDDGTVFRYAVQDDCGWEYEWQEGVELVQGDPHRINYKDAEAAQRWLEEMRVDHDIFSVDVYEHGNTMYSLSGTGPQCQFDTARGGACIAIPNDNHQYPFTNTEEAAAAILSEYTSWCNGDVYGVVELVKEGDDWNEIDPPCFGIIGWEYVEQCLREGV